MLKLAGIACTKAKIIFVGCTVLLLDGDRKDVMASASDCADGAEPGRWQTEVGLASPGQGHQRPST